MLASLPVTACILAGTGILLAHSVLRNIGVESEANVLFRQTLLPEVQKNLLPEAMERWLFILLTLASPFCILATLSSVHSLQRIFPSVWKSFDWRALLGGIAFMGGIGCFSLLHGNSLLMFSFFPDSFPVDLMILGVAGSFLGWFGALQREPTEMD